LNAKKKRTQEKRSLKAGSICMLYAKWGNRGGGGGKSSKELKSVLSILLNSRFGTVRKPKGLLYKAFDVAKIVGGGEDEKLPAGKPPTLGTGAKTG